MQEICHPLSRMLWWTGLKTLHGCHTAVSLAEGCGSRPVSLGLTAFIWASIDIRVPSPVRCSRVPVERRRNTWASEAGRAGLVGWIVVD